MSAVPSVCDAFNHTLRQFLEELVECSPKCDAVAKATTLLATFDIVTAADPSKLAQEFMAVAGPHAARISAKDATVFSELREPVDFQEAWAVNDDEQTRAAIWQYLQMLMLLGAGAIMPPETRRVIEATAATAAQKLQSGELDFASLTAGLMGGAEGPDNPAAALNLLGMFGNGGLGKLE